MKTMAKRKNNRVTQKGKVGRPSKYNPAYCQDLVNFFNVDRIIYKDITITYKNGDTVDKSVPEASPTPYFIDWCIKIGISQDTMNAWVKDYPEFSEAYKRAKQLQEAFLQECALKGVHNATFTIFAMKNVCGWRDESYLKGVVAHNHFFEAMIQKAESLPPRINEHINPN